MMWKILLQWNFLKRVDQWTNLLEETNQNKQNF